jgi:1,4-dihydroxy-2-naphthoate octaprenyltransferase
MIYEMIILVLPPILVLMYMMINHLQEQGKYYAFIFFVTVFPLMSLRRKIMAVKEPKELRPFSETSGDDYFCDEYFGGDWIELFFLKK